MKRKLIAMLLALCLLLPQTGAIGEENSNGSGASGNSQDIYAAPDSGGGPEEPAAQPAKAPEERPAEPPAAEPEEQPTQEPAQQPVEPPALPEQPVEPPAEALTAGPTPAPLFSLGYVRVDAGTAVYGSASMKGKAGVLTEKCVVYAFDRKKTNRPSRDPLSIAFATREGTVTAFVRAGRAEALSVEAAEAYVRGCDTGFHWNGDPGLPLGVVVFEPVPSGSDSSGEPGPDEEEPEETRRPEPEGPLATLPPESPLDFPLPTSEVETPIPADEVETPAPGGVESPAPGETGTPAPEGTETPEPSDEVETPAPADAEQRPEPAAKGFEPEGPLATLPPESPLDFPLPTSAVETPIPAGEGETPAPGGAESPAPGETGTPAPEGTETPEPSDEGEISAPGGAESPAPGETGTPAPGATGTPAPEATGTPAPGATRGAVKPVIEILAEPNPVLIGEQVTLTAVPRDLASALWQWQYSQDNLHWIDIEGANGPAYTFRSDETNIAWYYRALALNPVPAEPAPGESAGAAEQSAPGEPAEGSEEPAAEDSGGNLLAALGACLFPAALAEENFLASQSIRLTPMGTAVCRNTNTNKRYDSLAAAISEASDLDVIWLLEDVTLTAGITVEKYVILVNFSDAMKITGGSACSNMFTVVSGGKLQLQGSDFSPLTLDAASNGRAVRVDSGGTLVLDAGVEITGGTATNGGGVWSGGTFVMTGGTIHGNTADSGGGVYNAGEFTMSGGTIGGNTAGGGSGVWNDGTFSLSGDAVISGQAYLNGSSTIGAGASFTGSAMHIVPSAYAAGKQILNALSSGTYGAAMLARFGVAPQATGEPWMIDPNGALKRYEASVKSGSGSPVYYKAFQEALAAANTLGTATITLLSDAEMAGAAAIPGGKAITLVPDGIRTLSRGGFTGPMFSVAGSATLTLGGGTGSLTLDSKSTGGAANRPVTVNTDGTLNLNSGVTLTGGYATDGGGGVYNRGAVVMAGGAIRGNTANQGGGALNYGEFTLSGGEVSGNTANMNGGGLFNYGAFTMSGGAITGNTASLNGGGVFHEGGAFTLSGGAAIEDTAYLSGDRTIQLGASFTGSAPNIVPSAYAAGKQVLSAPANGATYGATTLACLGVVPQATGGPWMITRNGVLKRYEASVTVGGSPPVYYKAFQEAVTAANIAGTATITLLGDAEIVETVTISGGKAITLVPDGTRTLSCGSGLIGMMFYVTGTLILGNGAGSLTVNGKNAAGDGGSHIAFVGANGTLNMNSGVTLTGGYTNLGGGVWTRGTFNMEGGAISNCTALTNGGGVYVQTGGTFNMRGGSVSGNVTSGDGGGVYSEGGTISMSGGSVSGNAAARGGGVFNGGAGSFGMSGGSVSGNTTTGTGTGGVHNGANAALRLSGSAVIGDQAYLSGEIILPPGAPFTGSALHIAPSSYVTGRRILAALTGGATYDAVTLARFGIVRSSAGYWVIDQDGRLVCYKVSVVKLIGDAPAYYATFEEALTAANALGNATITLLGDATLSGTAVFERITLAADGTRTLSRGNFSGPMLNVTGRLVLEGSGNLTINGNNAAGGDNRIVTVSSGGILDLRSNVTLAGGHASEGGGVYVASGGRLEIFGAPTIRGNTATDGGGVYVASGGNSQIRGASTIRGNTATDGGGVYVASGGRLEISDAFPSISYNTAVNGGGVHVASGGTATINGEIYSNTATSGGGVYVASGGTFSQSGRHIAYNTAGSGGGVYVAPGGTFNMTDGEIHGNWTGGGGSGVWNGGAFSLSDGAIIGDPVYLNGSSTIEVGASFTGSAPNIVPGAYAAGAQILKALPSGTYGAAMLARFGIVRSSTGYWFIDQDGKLLGYAASVTTGSGSPVHYRTFQEAMAAANTLETATLTLMGNAEMAGTVTIPAGKAITLVPDGTRTLSRGGGCTGAMFEVSGSLTLGGGSGSLTVDGKSVSGDSNRVATVKAGAALNVRAGVTLTGGCATDGGGVLNDGAFTMTGGVVRGNAATGRGGGVYQQGGQLSILGGAFQDNSAPVGGGLAAYAPVTIDTSSAFVNSTLYFGVKPILRQPVKLTLDSSAAGALAVSAADAKWLSAGDCQPEGMPGYVLHRILDGAGGALQLRLSTEVTITLSGITYGGVPAPSATVRYGSGGSPISGAPVTFAYSAAQAGPFAGNAPVNAGSYWIKASYAGDDALHYAPSEAAAAFAIGKATPTVQLANKTAACTGQPAAIDPAAVTGVNGAAIDGAVSYTYYDNAMNPLSGPPVDVGTYHVKATVAEQQNYTQATSAAATLTIVMPDSLSLTVPVGTRSYGGGYDLPVGATLQLGAGVPAGLTASFASSDRRVAMVSAQGLVKGVKAGIATITVSAPGTPQPATVVINVIIPVSRVALPAGVLLLTGRTQKLTAALSPANASRRALIWKSSDPSVASVASDGTVTAQGVGAATITATAASGVVGSCLLRVTDRTETISISTRTGVSYVDYKGSLQLTAAANPETAFDGMTWKSLSPKFATVDASGRVYGRKVGRAKITATARDGSNRSGTIVVQVILPLRSVGLPAAVKVFLGKPQKLTAALNPSKATFRALTWESSDPEAAWVAADGTVTAAALGTATITAKAYNGLTASCIVTVARPVGSIDLALKEKGDAVVYRGGTVSVAATVSPENASDKGVTWTSSNKRIATVDANGVVTGRAAGRVSITARAVDGSGAWKAIALTVAAPHRAVALNRASAVIYWNGGTDALRTVQLAAAASPRGTRYRRVTWTTDNQGVAAVNESTGLVTAVAAGTAVIRATTDTGKTAECAITVRALPDSVSLATTAKMLAFKQSYNLAADITITGGNEPALTWRSDNPKVATVSAAGVVRASKNKTGTAHITVTTKNGKTATCTITVVRKLP